MPATPSPAITAPAQAVTSYHTIPADPAHTPDIHKSADPRPQEGPRVQTNPHVQNRVAVLLTHIPFFSIQGQARLAARAGASRSTISRLVHGRINPSYRLAQAVTAALERQLGAPLDMRDVFTTDGTYPTASGCALCRCGGCLPEHAYDAEGNLLPAWKEARPGDWSLAPAMPDAPARS